MTPAQQAALEGIAGRPLTAQEIEQINPRLDPSGRDDVAIASMLSAGRTRSVPTEIGIGTVLAVVGEGGGAFLDRLVQIGQADRNVHWAFKLIERGAYRIDLPASRAGMLALAAAAPDTAGAISALLELGIEPDPINPQTVTAALNEVGHV